MTTQTRIPSLDLTGSLEALWPELLLAVEKVLRSTHYILGPEVRAFEEETARYLGVRHAVACNSGTDALVLGLRALGIGPGDEVITTPFTFFATAEAISNVGARPVFVDIDPGTFDLDPSWIDRAVTSRTRAIVRAATGRWLSGLSGGFQAKNHAASRRKSPLASASCSPRRILVVNSTKLFAQKCSIRGDDGPAGSPSQSRSFGMTLNCGSTMNASPPMVGR